MKPYKKILIWFLIIAGCFFLAISAFLQLKGKDLIINKIKTQYGRDVNIGYMFFSLPTGITVINVEVKGIGSARDIIAQIDIASLLAGKIKFKYISIKGGRFVTREGFLPYDITVEMSDVNLYLEDVYFPLKPAKSQFMFVARMDDEDSLFYNAEIDGKGWIDIAGKNMSADIRAFYPDKPASVNIALESLNDKMDVSGEINLKDISSFGSAKLIKYEPLKNLFHDSVSALGSDINIKFKFVTKMSDLNIENDKIFISGSIVKED